MRTTNYTETYSAVLGSLIISKKNKSLKNESEKSALSANEFIPEKSAEQIVAELRDSRSFGKTRIVEPF